MPRLLVCAHINTSPPQAFASRAPTANLAIQTSTRAQTCGTTRWGGAGDSGAGSAPVAAVRRPPPPYPLRRAALTAARAARLCPRFRLSIEFSRRDLRVFLRAQVGAVGGAVGGAAAGNEGRSGPALSARTPIGASAKSAIDAGCLDQPACRLCAAVLGAAFNTHTRRPQPQKPAGADGRGANPCVPRLRGTRVCVWRASLCVCIQRGDSLDLKKIQASCVCFVTLCCSGVGVDCCMVGGRGDRWHKYNIN